MDTFTRGPSGPEGMAPGEGGRTRRPAPPGEGRMRAIGALVALLATALLAAVLVAPAGSAHAASSGSVGLGIAAGKRVEAPEAGAKGSVSLGIAVGANVMEHGDTVAPEGGIVGIGIAAGHLPHHEVHFVEYYCDEAGGVLADTRGTLAPAQQVAWGGHATDPIAELGIEREGHWADAWYAVDPLAHPDAEPVPLDQIEVKSGTMLFCLWKKGYAVRLDPNNGMRDGAAVFDGRLEDGAAGYVAVARDVAFEEGGGTGDPEGYEAPAFPAAVRAGYAFKGWYWASEADGSPLKDSYGRAVLANADGDPVAKEKDEWGYSQFRDACTAGEGDGATIASRTLYAKWELDPGARLALEDARGPNDDDVYLWWWPGRGYATEQPAADFEATGKLYEAAGAIEGFGGKVHEKPVPATRLFRGWGVRQLGVAHDDGLDGKLVVSHERTGEGDAATDAYRFEEGAFAEGLWDLATMVDRDGDGWVEGTLEVVGSPVAISVAAPFRVTFDKGEGVPYSADELVWAEGGPQWIESREQEFTNYTGRAVYVSGLECVDAGGSSLLPGGRLGAPVFALYSGSRTAGTLAATSLIPFGYAPDSNRVAIDWAVKGSAGCIVLGGSEDAGADGVPTVLRYGLDLKAAAFDKAAMAVGNGRPEDDASYAASLANVKYTYALVPED